MNSVSSNRIVVFSKAAEAGRVKTRMLPALDHEKCLSLHLALLKDTLDKVRSFPSVLYLTGSGNLPFDPGMPVRIQSGADLGERMLNAFTEEFVQFSRVVIIGTDSPAVPVQEIIRAFSALDDHDVVLGPCEDGGYYLIGLKELIPEIFHGIPWGGKEVLRKTLEKISNPHAYFLLDSYYDIDVPQDLFRLQKEIEKQSNLENVRAWLTDHVGPSAR